MTLQASLMVSVIAGMQTPSPEHRLWLDAWRGAGSPALAPGFSLGVNSQADDLVLFSGGIIATYLGGPVEGDGLRHQVIRLEGWGIDLGQLLARVDPLGLKHHGGILDVTLPPEARLETVFGLPIGLNHLIHGTHLAAAMAEDDADALRALGYLRDLGERIALIERRQISQAACRTCGTRPIRL